MVFVGLLQWWYGAGWLKQLLYARDKIMSIYDYFSIDLLFKSWFAPFRQISAGKVQGSLAVQWHAFVDRTISRFIGAFMRTCLIIFGCVAIIAFTIAGLCAVILWAFLPFAPIAGVILATMGWMPWIK